MNNLIGDSSKNRMLAFVLDNGIAIVLSLIAAGMVNPFGGVAVITRRDHRDKTEATSRRPPCRDRCDLEQESSVICCVNAGI